MYEHISFKDEAGHVEATDYWVCYRNARNGVRLIPTAKSLAGWLKRRLTAKLWGIVPKFSLY